MATDEIMEGQVGMFDQDSAFTRMSPEPSAPTAAKTSKPSSQKSSASQTPMLPMCLCLKRESGQNPAASTMKWEDGQLLGEYTMHSFGECPNEENVSQLSQILEDSPHPKYSLSATAAAGILRRAKARGKELPPILEQALIEQVERIEKGLPKTSEDIEPMMIENHPNDSRVKIEKDGVAQALSGRMGTGGNNTPLVLEGGCPSCDCSEPGGSHSVNVERERTQKVTYSVGNGQAHDAQSISEEVHKTLNCLQDPAKILITDRPLELSQPTSTNGQQYNKLSTDNSSLAPPPPGRGESLRIPADVPSREHTDIRGKGDHDMQRHETGLHNGRNKGNTPPHNTQMTTDKSSDR